MKLRFVKEAFPALHPGRSAAVYLGSKRIGFIGELHPKAAQAYELPHAPVVSKSRCRHFWIVRFRTTFR